MAENWYQPFKEFYQHGKAMVTAGLGKLGVETGFHAVPMQVAEVGAQGATSVLSGTVGGAVLFGGFGALSAVVNQIEYSAERGKIADFYREELAAKLGKSPDKVLDSDIDILALGDKNKNIPENHVIDEKLKHERSERNVGILASFIASLTVFSLMTILLTAIGAPHDLSVTAMAAKGVVGLLAYMSIKRPLVAVGEALFGVNKITTHDLIENITKDREHGRAISREQVVEIFIKSNQQLAEYVEQKYGFSYDHLPLADKVKVVDDIANILPVDKIADNINLGKANASELAFTVQGDISGVLPKTAEDIEKCEKEKSLLGKISDKCRNLVKVVNRTLHPEKAHPIASISAINKAHKKHEESGAAKEVADKQKFTEMLAARSGADQSLVVSR